MPNWCNNSVTISHPEPAIILELKQAILDDKFFQHIHPVPQQLIDTVSGHLGDGYEQELNQFKMQLNEKYFGYPTWYDFCTNEWSTKWDASSAELDTLDENTLIVTFDTAWAPPIGVFEKMLDMGYSVEAYYYEPGCAFVGHWEDGDDQCYNIPGTSEEISEAIPAYLDEMWGISESMEMWEDE